MSRSWISLHLFYHDDLNHVITGWVRELIADVRARAMLEQYFFIRYWQGGSHIRLRLLPAAGVPAEALQRTAEASAAAFLAAQPSTTVIRLDKYLRATEPLTYLEYGEDRRLPVYPNNSVHEIAYVPELDRYGGALAMPLVEQQFAASSDCVCELLAHNTSRAQRFGLSFSMMILALAQWNPQVEILHEAATVRYQQWLRMLNRGEALNEEQFEQQYQRQHQQLLALARRYTAPETRVDALHAAWAGSIGTLCVELARLGRRDALHTRPKSTATLAALPPWANQVMAILFSVLHMHNNRMQIELFEEAYLWFLLKRALGDAVQEIAQPAGVAAR